MNQRQVTEELMKFLGAFAPLPMSTMQTLIVLRQKNIELFRNLALVGIDFKHQFADERMMDLTTLLERLKLLKRGFRIKVGNERGVTTQGLVSGKIILSNSRLGQRVIAFEAVDGAGLRSFCSGLYVDQLDSHDRGSSCLEVRRKDVYTDSAGV